MIILSVLFFLDRMRSHNSLMFYLTVLFKALIKTLGGTKFSGVNLYRVNLAIINLWLRGSFNGNFHRGLARFAFWDTAQRREPKLPRAVHLHPIKQRRWA